MSPPQGWDVRIARRQAEHPEATSNPVLHAASFPLPTERGDFGGFVTPLMSSTDVFVVLFEYDREATGTALFAQLGRPRPRPEHFNGRQLQRTIPGQAGVQYFFQENGRAFCLYIVLGAASNRVSLASVVNDVLDTLEIDPAGAA
ncbi:MAG: hypothetical protein M3Z02_00575 [Actinomycetota bacterium]|nr:hypothetical protein [Actinomycetota bacterium]